MRYLVLVLLLFVMSWQFAVAQTTALPCSATDIDIDDDGLIDICYLEQLNAIRNNLSGSGSQAQGCPLSGCNGYELMRDLDFLDDAGYSSTSNKAIWTVDDYADSTDTGWQPIGGVFHSTFKGNNHALSNLMINRPATDNVGLFQHVGPLISQQPGGVLVRSGSATIVNLRLLNINVKGNKTVGGVAGLNLYGSIANSYVGGNIEGSENVGGLVGFNNNGSITDNKATCNVKGRVYVGGLVGFSNNGSITDNEVTCNIEGRVYVGGLAGRSRDRIADSHAGGSVKGGDSVGGLVGLNNGSIANSYASGDVEGNRYVGGLLGDSLSRGDVGNSYAVGRVKGNDEVGGLIGYNESPITMSYAEGDVEGNRYVGGLVGLNDNRITDSYATGNVLGRFIYAGGLIGGNNDDISNSYATGNVEANRHVGGLIGGTQDGDITGSYATGNVTGSSPVGGLIAVGFGEITDSYATGDVVGTDYVGGLIAVGFGDITGSYAKGDVSGKEDVGGLIAVGLSNITDSYATGDVAGVDYVGGLVAVSHRNITGSYATGDVVGNDYIGGLVGLNFVGGQTINSYAEGDVVGVDYVGGLVARSFSQNNTINSYAEGDVTGAFNVGGLSGGESGSIVNSYAIGNVKGRPAGSFPFSQNVGGLVGRLTQGNIIDAYAGGDVTGVFNVGGLVGQALARSFIINGYAKGRVTASLNPSGLVATGSNYFVENSYWDNTKTASSAKGTGFSSDALKSPTAPGSSQSDPYYSWSIDNWHFGTAEQYPVLKYNKGTVASMPACGSAADLPDCDALLSGQRVGLATLSLPGGPILLPPFNSEIRDYRVFNSSRLAHVQLIPTAVNSSATITVRSGGFSTAVVSGMTSSAIPLNNSGTTSITVEVAEADGKRVAYTLDVNNSTFNEGERIVLDGAAIYGADRDSLSYRWTQVSGVSLLSGLATDQAVLNIKLREDLIPKTSDTVVVVLRLAVSEAGTVIDSEDVTLTITKIDNGFIRLSAAPTLQGSILTAPEIDLAQDPDGTGSLDADSYQWQQHAAGSAGWVDIGSPAKTYQIPTNAAMNTEYRVQFGYGDGQGYVRRLVSQAFTYRQDIDVDGDGLIEINDLDDLNAMRYQLDGTGYKASDTSSKITAGCPAGGCKGYELVRDLDFGDDAGYGLGIANKADWTSGLGWQPIGTFEKPFNSIFRANGHTISNLYINRIYTQNDVGLFGATGDKAEIADVGLLDVDIAGRDGVGGLVGYKRGGTVRNSYVTGRVAGEGLYEVGGLVGWHRGGTIADSYTSSTVVATGKDSGGLVGNNDNATITNSYALGSVAANENSGGLVGRNTGIITRSYATGAVEGGDVVGGLVGHNRGIITNSQATGGVAGDADVGGLAGWSSGDITNSYAVGSVAGSSTVGGFIGNNLRGTITNSYARGDVSGIRQYIGGFIGWNGAGTITDSYAWGDVSGQEDVGGLVGVNNRPAGLIDKSYAVGRVVGTEDAGGLVGENRRGTITKSYWNITNNPTTTSAGGTSKTSVELQTPTAAGSTTTEIYYDWQSDDWDFAGETRYPLLRHAVGPDNANPACGASDDLPDCGTLLSGQLQSAGLIGLTLSEGATLSPHFAVAVYDYHVNVKASASFLSVQLTASDADATIRISTDGGFVADNASSDTRISLVGATLITITVIPEYGTPSEYRLYINRIPEIVPIGDTSVAIKAGREQTIDVMISDADIEDVLTLSLRAIGGSPDIVELTTTTVTISASGGVARAVQSLGIKGLKAGNTMLELTVGDEHVAATVSLPVMVSANTTPTINGLSDVGLLAETETTLDVTLGDADDDDDVDDLKARVQSSNEAIATASIAETGDAARVLTINAGSASGMATITVLVDDDRGVANSVITETFGVVVEVNETPMLTIKSSPAETISLGSTASLVVSVADANFDVDDSVNLEVASDSAVSVEPAGIVDIRGDTDKTFVLTAAQAGTAMISITATDSRGASVSETVSVRVNAPPMIAIDDEVTVKAGREGSVDVTVSDANLDDLLTLSLRVVNSNQDIVELTTMDVAISTNSSTERAQQSLGIKGLKAGSTLLALFLRDKQDTVTTFLTVTVSANTAPTISGLSDIRLLTNTETTLNVTLGDADDDDDVDRLKASAESDNDAIATASIADTQGAERVLTVSAGSMVGTAVITVMVDDDRRVANSVISETFEVVVEANEAPTLEIKSPRNQTITLGSTASLVVSVSDANFDVNDSVDLEVVSSTSTVSVEPADIVDIRGDTDKKFLLTGAKAGMAMIRITATDSSSASTSETVSVRVNAPPTISGLSDIRLLTDAETTMNVTLDDEDDDDVANLKASAKSSNAAIATASIPETGDATRILTVSAGSTSGTAVITVLVDDGRGVANSVSSETFEVVVEANEAPTLEIKSPLNRIIELGSTASIIVSVADANFGVNDSVDLEVVSSTSAVSVEPADIVDIRGDTDKTFVLTATRAGTAIIRVTATDSKGASVSETVSVRVNALPMIDGLSNIRLLTDVEATLNVTLSDANDDDVANLKASAKSSNAAIATASIPETGDATRILTVSAGSTSGMAVITVLVDDGRGVANSVSSETFEVSVEANEAPTLEIKSPLNRIIELGSTASIIVSVADANFDANDNVALEVMSSTSTVSVEPAGKAEIRGDTDKTFVITGAKAGTATIRVTATDSESESVSETVSVHVNASPMIVSYDVPDTIKAGRVQSINATVSDANREDVLTLLLSATDENQDIVELATTSVTVSANGNAERAQQSFSIKGSKAGSTDLALTVRDEHMASATVMLTVMVTANTTPTISDLSDIKLLTSSETTLDVALDDADADDDVANLKASAKSSNAAIATASIAETGGATRVLTVRAGSRVGTAMVTVMVDDDREVANSVISETFKVVVEADEAPIIGTLAPMSVAEGDTIDAGAAVSDANNDDLSYQWEITDEADGSTINIADSPLFVVPTDLVEPPAEATTLTLMLTVSDGRTNVSTRVSVIVERKDNGAVIPTVLTREGLELMPPTIDLSADPDGAGTSATYVWQRCSANCSADGAWSDIGEASDSATAYMIEAGQAGYRFRLKVDYIDGQGYENVIFYNSGIRIRARVFLEGPLQ